MTEPLILQIPIPLCDKHIKDHKNKPFIVHTCNNWYYLAIPVILGSLKCRECLSSLFIPMPFLCSANLSSANLSSADLRSAKLSSANLYLADLRSANLRLADLYLANLSSANLSSADLYLANLRSANLRSAKNLNEAYNLDKAYWNKFTKIDNEFKKLLNKDRFIE